MTFNPGLASLALGALCSSALAQIQPVTEPLPAADSAPTSHFWWSDYDGDGDRDAFVVHPGADAVLLANHGDGSFEDITAHAGLGGLAGVSQALWQDVDGDGLPELYLVVPGGVSVLLRHVRGSFTEITDAASLALDTSVHYGEWLDVDGDQRADLHLSTARGELVLHNLGDSQFREVDLGLAAVELPWSSALSAWTRRSERTPPRGAEQPSGEGSSAATAGTPVVGVTPTGPHGQGTGTLFCYDTLEDQATGNCVQVSSTPTIGALYPLSQDWFVDGGTGFVGVGTTSPATRLEVDGDLTLREGLLSGRNSTDTETIRFQAAGASDGARLRLRDQAGIDRHLLRGDTGLFQSSFPDGSSARLLDGAAELFHPSDGVVPRASLTAQGANAGGGISLTNDASAATVEVLGDGGGDEGRLVLRDASSGSAVDTVLLSARASLVGGGGVTLNDSNGQVGALLGGEAIGGGGLLRLLSGGVTAFSMGSDLLRGVDSGGSDTFTLDRQTGSATQPVDAAGFLKAAVVVTSDGTEVRSFNNISTTLTVQRIANGLYNIRFIGADLTNRFFTVQQNQSDSRNANVFAVTETVTVSFTKPIGVFSPFPPPGVVVMSTLAADSPFTLFVY